MTKARGWFQVTSMHEETYEELEGIRGDRGFEASRGTEASYGFDYELG